MTAVDPLVTPNTEGEFHDEGHTGPADPIEPLVPTGNDGVRHDASSDSRHILNTLPPDLSSSEAYIRLLPDPFFQPDYHPTCESYSCFLRDSGGRYSGVQVQLALPNDEDLPIYVNIPHLGIHGLAFRTSGGPPSRQTTPSATQAEESPVEQENGRAAEIDGHLGHAGGADERDGHFMAMMNRLLNMIWPWPVHMI